MASPACRHLGTCALASDHAGFSPEFIRIMRTTWCRGSYAECARYRAALIVGPQAVPGNLFPAERERVADLYAGL
ncbi:MAG: hypothetical protein JXP72_10300 [Coriobacteriia bacterium]|nr:hypothetical protein [Coriobacteriia bacterium]